MNGERKETVLVRALVFSENLVEVPVYNDNHHLDDQLVSVSHNHGQILIRGGYDIKLHQTNYG